MRGKYLTPEDVANEFGVHPETVRRWIHQGKLRAFKPGREHKILPTDLEEFMRAREVVPKEAKAELVPPELREIALELLAMSDVAQISHRAEEWAKGSSEAGAEAGADSMEAVLRLEALRTAVEPDYQAYKAAAPGERLPGALWAPLGIMAAKWAMLYRLADRGELSPEEAAEVYA